jgi:glycosyltransferase involved in cell wall biosynthesis
MEKKKQLSLCVITKNDEAFLPDCLNDMKESADEILVADLGSDDRTVELAERAGAKVYRPGWEDDFSKIKNFCMEHAAGKWVLFLQADEAIPKDQRKELRFLLKNPNAEGYLLYAGYDPKERNITSHTQFLRLIRSRKEYRFCYRSFEWIPDEVLSSLCDSRLCIAHRGEKTAGWQLEERKRLLGKDLEEHPQDSYLRYLEGIEFLNRENCRESAASLEQARQAIGCGRFYGPQLYKCLGVSLLSLERYEEAEEALDEGLRIFPFYNDLLVLRAELYRKLGRNREALENLKICLALRKEPDARIPGSEISTSIVRDMMEKIKDR